jgi:sulfur transfer protein SufE
MAAQLRACRRMPLSMDAELQELAAEFDLLGDWEERYRYIIELGRTLAPLTDAWGRRPFEISRR